MAEEKNKDHVKGSGRIRIGHEKNARPVLQKIKDAIKNPIRGVEKALVNVKSKSSIVIRRNGDISAIANSNAQQKINANGKTTEMSKGSTKITNRAQMSIDDLIINNHKMNQQLLKLTDLVNVLNNEKSAVGYLTMSSSVMVKAWEPTLKKYVMIRRPAYVQPFMQELNTPKIHPDLDIKDKMNEDMVEQAKRNEVGAEISTGKTKSKTKS